MNYDLIKNFITVAKTKNITHSAEILFVSQSTASHRLQQLEDILGYQLFLRNKGQRFATLTDHGKTFLPIAEKWMALWEETENFRNAKKEAKLVVGMIDSLLVCLLRDMVADCVSSNPDVHLQIKTMNSDDIFRGLKEQEIDLGITLANFPYQNVNIRTLLTEKMYCICKKGMFDSKKIIEPEDLLPYEEVLLNWGVEFMLWHNFWFKGHISPKLQVDTINLIGDMLKLRNSWSIVPETVARYFEKHGICDCHELKNPPPNRTLYLVTSALPDPNKIKQIRTFEQELDAFIANYCKNRSITHGTLA